MSYFKSDNAVRGIFGEKAYRKLVQLLDPCCGAGGADLITIPIANYSFAPNARKTYLQYNAEFTGENVNLSLDSVANAQLGDLLTVFCYGSGNINLDSNFYYTECGGSNSTITVDGRMVINFTFDGVTFTNSYDNC